MRNTNIFIILLPMLFNTCVITHHGLIGEKCIITAANRNCSLDLGDVDEGVIIKPWVRIKNIGKITTHIYLPHPLSTCVPALVDTPLKPGEVKWFELRPLNTSNLQGPITKTESGKCEPAVPLQVTLYKSH